MSPSIYLKDYKNYLVHLARYRNPFPCPHCGHSILAKRFEHHCATHHGLDPKLACVWCRGDRSWTKGHKNENSGHLLQCWLEFKSTLLPKSDVPDLTYISPPQDAFGRSLDDLPLEPIFPTPADPCTLSLGDPYLDLAASYFQKYLRTVNDSDWIHVMVRGVAFPSFVQAMEADQGRSTTLPFWCWCDGGPYVEDRYRRHRHMLVVSSPQGHFKRDVWSQVKPLERPFKHFPCKDSRFIKSPKHLINTLGYLCQQKSQCNFGAKSPLPKEKNLHFFFYYPLPSLFKYALALLYRGGVLEQVHEEYSHMDPSLLATSPGLRNGVGDSMRWELFVKDIPGIPLHIRVAVEAHIPDQYLYLGPGRVERLAAGKKRWIHLYQVVENETWFPSPFQQTALNTNRVTVNRLNAEMERLKGELNQALQRGEGPSLHRPERPLDPLERAEKGTAEEKRSFQSLEKGTAEEKRSLQSLERGTAEEKRSLQRLERGTAEQKRSLQRLERQIKAKDQTIAELKRKNLELKRQIKAKDQTTTQLQRKMLKLKRQLEAKDQGNAQLNTQIQSLKRKAGILPKTKKLKK